MKFAVGAAVLSFAIGVGSAFAQTPAPAGQAAAHAKMSQDDKKAISKSCSDQANTKGLHGKARKKFRSACKQGGGKSQ
jgi:psiF repeat